MEALKSKGVGALLAVIVLIVAILLVIIGRLDLITGGLIAVLALAILFS